jgi:hypothetical protein
VTGRPAVLAGFLLGAALGAGCSVIQGDQLTDAQQVIAELKTGPSDLKIVGRVEQADRHYRTGEPIALSFEVNKPAYVAVLRVLPNGVTTRLFPNKYQGSAQVAPATSVRVPPPGAPLTISAGKTRRRAVRIHRCGEWRLLAVQPQADRHRRLCRIRRDDPRGGQGHRTVTQARAWRRRRQREANGADRGTLAQPTGMKS